MNQRHFTILYRLFLLRIADLELLSPGGDMSKLLGQFGALLLFLGTVFSMTLMGIDGRLPRQQLLVSAWPAEHSLIAATMLAVGLFAILSWESVFPDLRDVLVLAALPVRLPVIFAARIAASASALTLTVLLLNALSSVALSLALDPHSSSVLDLIFSPARYRTFAAYWATVFAAGLFVYCSILSLQGLAAVLLRRRWYLSISAMLQMAAFCLLLSVYFLQPSLTTPATLGAPENQRLLHWLPSHWFLGLFQILNDSSDEITGPLAGRAVQGLALVTFTAFSTCLLSWFRSFSRIIEEPDIVRRHLAWLSLPRFGNPLTTAIVHFSLRTMLRSRRHRLLMAFYLGIGFGIMTLFLWLPRSQQTLASLPLRQIFASIVMVCICLIGTRVIFGIPFELKANWIFRLTQVLPPDRYFSAIRVALFTIGLVPVWVAAALFFFSEWTFVVAAKHLLLLALGGTGGAWLCLYGLRKIPFTCSWLPGRSFFHMTFLAALGGLILMAKAAAWEWQMLPDSSRYIATVAALCAAAAIARWRILNELKSLGDERVQFEQLEDPVLQGLDLQRDGMLPERLPSR